MNNKLKAITFAIIISSMLTACGIDEIEVDADNVIDLTLQGANSQGETSDSIDGVGNGYVVSENRIFNEYGFSVESDFENLLIFPSTHISDYTSITNDLVNLMIGGVTDEYEEYYDDFLNNSFSYIYAQQSYIIPFMFTLQNNFSYEDELYDLTPDELTDLVNQYASQIFSITTEDVVIEGLNCKHTTVTLDISDLPEEYIQELDSITLLQTEIFSVPYIDKSTSTYEYYDVIFDGMTNLSTDEITIDTTAEMTKIIDSFMWHDEISTTNESGLKSFKSVAFSSYYNPDYFATALSPEHYNTLLSLEYNDKLLLILTDENTDFYLDVECDYYEIGINMNEELLALETMTINDKQFDVYKYNVSGEEVIVTISHYTDEPYPNTTWITLDNYDSYSLGLDAYNSLSSSDIAIVNDIFETIMEHYEVSYSPTMLMFLEMQMEWDNSYNSSGDSSYVEETVTTEDGFVMRGTTLTGYVGDEVDIIIPDGVETIGREAFKGNDTIRSVVLSDTVTTVGDSAFMQSSLKEVTISNSVTKIEQYGFAYCTEMEVLNFGNSVESIGDLAFNGSWSLKELDLPDSLKTIGETAFSSAKSLTTLVIPNSVTSIGRNAFGSCRELESVILSSNLTVINESTFSNCVKLATIEIPSTVTTIDANAFEDCESLTEVVLENPHTEIDDDAFKGCDGLDIRYK